MSRICELTGKRPQTGSNVSNSNRHTKRTWVPNLRVRTFAIPGLKTEVTVKLSVSALRTIDKLGGFTKALHKAKDANLSQKLLTLKNRLKRLHAAGKPAAKPAA